MKGDARLRLAFGVWGLAWKTDGVKSERAKGRMGEWAKVVPTAFEDEDDDKYEDDGFARGLA